MDATDCTPVCAPACRSVFDRVVVRHYIKGGTRVMWELLESFPDPNPLSFQLQVGVTGSNDSDDWTDVGLPVENQYSATDPDQHVWGKDNWTHYRVVLTTPAGVYYSEPTGGLGILTRREWLLARELVRQRLLEYRKGFAAQEGYLLKRRWTGDKCPTCLDLQTQEPRDPDCPDCYGTGYRCGYYYPMSCVYAKMQPRSRRLQLDPQRATTSDIVVKADMLMIDLMGEDDVWVAKKSDDRYYVHRIDNVAEVRGVAVAGSVELRPVAYTSCIYSIAIPDQLAYLEG